MDHDGPQPGAWDLMLAPQPYRLDKGYIYIYIQAKQINER